MNLESVLRRLSRQAPASAVALAGAAILLGVHSAASELRSQAMARQEARKSLLVLRERASAAAAELQTLRDLKARDIAHLKKGLSKLTESRRTLYEAGLSLQEENRLLQKQWEMMATYLLIDVPAQKIHVMRGDQALESFAVGYASAAFGDAAKSLPPNIQIVSKERYAHPERGQSEQVDGQLVWTPPQVGTSVRSNALGEYVMFTQGDLILHGPPKKRTDHAAFAHYCVGLSLNAARKLYQASFIGTHIYLKKK